ncbi:MAG: Uncharacterised protein [SAR116 cluster bacterium]|nr:MAG: Uncharacterised protein [SAR116 cluster bacterium]
MRQGCPFPHTADHVAFASIARGFCNCKSCCRQPASYLTGGCKAGKTASNFCQPADFRQDICRPGRRVARRCKPVKKPAIHCDIEGRQNSAHIPVMQMQRQPSPTQHNKVMARPARRQCLPQLAGQTGQLGKGRMRSGHHLGIQGLCLKRHKVDLAMRMVLHFGHNRQQIQPGAKTRLANCQMRCCFHPGGQVIPFKKDVPCFGQPVISIVIAVCELHRMRHPIAHVDLRKLQIIISVQMRGCPCHGLKGSILMRQQHSKNAGRRYQKFYPASCESDSVGYH